MNPSATSDPLTKSAFNYGITYVSKLLISFLFIVFSRQPPMIDFILLDIMIFLIFFLYPIRCFFCIFPEYLGCVSSFLMKFRLLIIHTHKHNYAYTYLVNIHTKIHVKVHKVLFISTFFLLNYVANFNQLSRHLLAIKTITKIFLHSIDAFWGSNGIFPNAFFNLLVKTLAISFISTHRLVPLQQIHFRSGTPSC